MCFKIYHCPVLFFLSLSFSPDILFCSPLFLNIRKISNVNHTLTRTLNAIVDMAIWIRYQLPRRRSEQVFRREATRGVLFKNSTDQSFLAEFPP